MEARNRRANVIALRQRKIKRRAQTLYAAWRIPYTAPRQHMRRLSVHPPPLPAPKLSTSHHLKLSHGKWLESRARVMPQGQPKPNPIPLHSRIAKTSKCEDHRAWQLELGKLRIFH
jgi:hypothetical protein